MDPNLSPRRAGSRLSSGKSGPDATRAWCPRQQRSGHRSNEGYRATVWGHRIIPCSGVEHLSISSRQSKVSGTGLEGRRLNRQTPDSCNQPAVRRNTVRTNGARVTGQEQAVHLRGLQVPGRMDVIGDSQRALTFRIPRKILDG